MQIEKTNPFLFSILLLSLCPFHLNERNEFMNSINQNFIEIKSYIICTTAPQPE